jgi:hypothetical protein
MDEQELILLAETSNDDEANEAMAILRKYYDPTYMWCADCDYIVVKEKDCCLNKIEWQ